MGSLKSIILKSLKRCFKRLILPDNSAILWHQREGVRHKIFTHFNRVEMVLDIGSGSRPVSGFKKVICMDFDPSCNVDILGDACCIPIKKEEFDLAWLGGVLEHIKNSTVAIAEIHRILKSGGYVYIEMPFFQRVHGAPYDFQRFTLTGLESLLSAAGFNIVQSGIISGPSSAFAHILRTYLSLMFSFNNDRLFNCLYYCVFGWVTLPIKYFDLVLFKYRNAETVSFGIYCLGQKK